MDKEHFKAVALEALAEYKQNEIFSLTKMQKMYDVAGLDIKLDPHAKAEQAVLALVLHLYING